jgi:hypothetical protein
MGALSTFFWVLTAVAFAWLICGEPWYAQRRKERTEHEMAAWRREIDLALVYAQMGEQGLKRVLLLDLKMMACQRALREGRPVMEALDLLRSDARV